MTINQVIVDVILFAFAAVLSWAIKSYLVPYLKEQNLENIANTVVLAAESIFGAGHGADKFDYCVKAIEEKYKIKVDIAVVTNAIESAWQTLNMDQINSGIKEN